MKDISEREDIILFVDTFYHAVRQDPLIGPVFGQQIPDDHWPRHLERMYSFWTTVLLGKAEYRGNPFAKHANLPIEALHFTTWIRLFRDAIDAHFSGPKAEETKGRAEKMSLMFQAKLAQGRGDGSSTNRFRSIL